MHRVVGAMPKIGGPCAARRAVRLDMVHDHLSRWLSKAFLSATYMQPVDRAARVSPLTPASVLSTTSLN